MSTEIILPSEDEPTPESTRLEPEYPSVGDWYWVKWDGDDNEKSEREGWRLMCVDHIASNHISFNINTVGGSGSHFYTSTRGMRVGFDDWKEQCEFEPNWSDIINARIGQLQLEMRKGIKLLSDAAQRACIVERPEDQTLAEKSSQERMLPSVLVNDPNEHKKDLIEIRDKTIPEAQELVKRVGEELGVEAINLALPDKNILEQMRKELGVVDDRIFTIEIYAGLAEIVHQIAEGEPAGIDEPIVIRQMLRYMDEETLFDYGEGGMDITSLNRFDQWIVQPKNLERIIPEKRSIVAFRVRRKEKDYGVPTSLLAAFQQMELHRANMNTYLLIRNGENVYRIASDVDFSPRLVPLRGELEGPLESRWSAFDKEKKPVTPDHFDYDEALERKNDEVKKYNRILLLLQGLLDRSTVFHPHKPVALLRDDASSVVALNRDEEDVIDDGIELSFVDYRNKANESLRKGDWVYSAYEEELGYDYRNDRVKVRYPPKFSEVTQIRRDRSAVRVSWPWGTRWGYKNRAADGTYWGEWGEWEVNKRRHMWIPMDQVFRVESYQIGDYKQFLCNPYLKGRYLEWAPTLVSCENRRREEFIDAVFNALADSGRTETHEIEVKSMLKTVVPDFTEVEYNLIINAMNKRGWLTSGETFIAPDHKNYQDRYEVRLRYGDRTEVETFKEKEAAKQYMDHECSRFFNNGPVGSDSEAAHQGRVFDRDSGKTCGGRRSGGGGWHPDLLHESDKDDDDLKPYTWDKENKYRSSGDDYEED